jgi:hypothetical protein
MCIKRTRFLVIAKNGCVALKFPEDGHLLPPEWNGRYPTRKRREWILKLSEQQNHRCCYCGVETWTPYDDGPTANLWGGPKHKRATVEHILARFDGGTNRKGNVVMACARCNQRRDRNNPYIFMLDLDGRLDKFSLVPLDE